MNLHTSDDFRATEMAEQLDLALQVDRLMDFVDRGSLCSKGASTGHQCFGAVPLNFDRSAHMKAIYGRHH